MATAGRGCAAVGWGAAPGLAAVAAGALVGAARVLVEAAGAVVGAPAGVVDADGAHAARTPAELETPAIASPAKKRRRLIDITSVRI
ncbi:MAG: hypothetical protein ACR2IK_05345 [Chloroflexota bacterium]